MKKLLLCAFALAAAVCGNAKEVTDTLTAAKFGITADVSQYAGYTYTSDVTGISYSAWMASTKATIQLRSKDNQSGIVATANPNGLKAVKVSVVWTNNTLQGRTVNFYGKDAAYTATTNLFVEAEQGSLLGSSSCAEKAVSEIENVIDLSAMTPFIGIRSNADAMYFKNIVITYNVPETGKADAGLDFAESTVSAVLGQPFTAPVLSNPNGLAVTYSSANEDVATVDAAGNVTLVGAGTTTITAASEATDKYNAGRASYILKVSKATITATSIADLYAKVGTATDQPMLVDFPLTVTYVNGLNIYVTDGTSYSLVYGTNSYAKGDIIPAGWTCLYAPYSGLPELKPAPGVTLPAASGTAAVTYRQVELADVGMNMLNEVVIIKSVTFDAPTPATKANFNGANGEDNLLFRNNFTVESVIAGTYDVTAVVACYNSTVQVYPIAYGNTTALSTIEAAAAPAEYYNLQGIRVANPDKGIFIRKQGTTVTKVVL